MARILLGATPEGAVSLERILQGHECTVVSTMNAAQTTLGAQAFDLIIAALHFDESQMFALIEEVKKSRMNADKPIICFCWRDTPISRVMHESLECSTKLLGAWMYLDVHEYDVYHDPDAELRRVIERCLIEESRKDIQLKRLEIQNQRAELQKLRLMLKGQEWTPELKEYLDDVKNDLELLLKEVTRLHLAADSERASVVASRDLKDRVADRVTMNENGMSSAEENQSANETKQSAQEELLGAQEDSTMTLSDDLGSGH